MGLVIRIAGTSAAKDIVAAVRGEWGCVGQRRTVVMVMLIVNG
jgi:hypothetical protein